MGKPLNKKFFGDPSADGEQLSVNVWFTGEGSSETGWIVRQRGTGIYEITNGVLTERLKLQNGAPIAGGQASMQVGPFGTSGTTATGFETLDEGAVAGVVITSGGNGYLSAPVVTITGDGINAAATAFLLDDVVNSVIVDTGGSGYSSEPTTVAFGVPTGTAFEYVRTILSHGVKTYQGNVYDWDVISATKTGQGDLPLS